MAVVTAQGGFWVGHVTCDVLPKRILVNDYYSLYLYLYTIEFIRKYVHVPKCIVLVCVHACIIVLIRKYVHIPIGNFFRKVCPHTDRKFIRKYVHIPIVCVHTCTNVSIYVLVGNLLNGVYNLKLSIL
jgi:hypothetical protein